MTVAQSLHSKNVKPASAKRFNSAPGDDLETRTRAAANIAADHADAVDQQGRFPAEAFDALRRRKSDGSDDPQGIRRRRSRTHGGRGHLLRAWGAPAAPPA